MNYLNELRKLFSDKRVQLLAALIIVSAALGIIAAVSPPETRTYYFYRDETASGESGLYVSGSSFRVSSPDNLAEAETVNINTASVWELAGILPGIGEKKAAAIVEYREITGGFGSVDELIEVDGIGETLLENIRPYCRVSDSASESDAAFSDSGS